MFAIVLVVFNKIALEKGRRSDPAVYFPGSYGTVATGREGAAFESFRNVSLDVVRRQCRKRRFNPPRPSDQSASLEGTSPRIVVA